MEPTLIFPNDDNGNILRRMHEEGEDLSQSKNIEFTVLFPNSDSVQEFGSYFYNFDFDVRAKKSEINSSLPWSVVVTLQIQLTYEAITTFEQKLETVALPLGGRNNGWACFSGITS